ncbi:ExsB protein [Elusimicrobium minutum Pei191]|uniref:7-cyano-7-deazaguanine synthase n=1 Tax=Elusimicrobium minutum (strain Pei191) TaxID=445932 RepID=B2KDX5_ELUMP|nr:7-cyano-7-deazaguanine synthase QueC [Elusimicrobium minutum]ACC98721.1 ExsB protein [Elusimicrobium minutum Pei191]
MNIVVANSVFDCENWEGNALVIDVLRSSTTVCALVNRGKEDIRVYGDKDLAAHYKNTRSEVELFSELIIEGVNKEDNSPFLAGKSNPKKPGAIVTTAGTPAVMSLENAKEIFMGGYCNIYTLSSYLKSLKEDLLIVPSNLFGHSSDIEDAVCAESYMQMFSGLGNTEQDIQTIKNTARYEDFIKNGPKTAVKDAALCLTVNSIPVIPIIKIMGGYGVVCTPFNKEKVLKREEESGMKAVNNNIDSSVMPSITQRREIPAKVEENKTSKKKAVVLFSGGLDSTVCLYWALKEGYECYALSVAYGQKHLKEIEVAQRLAKQAGVTHKHIEINLPWLAEATSLVGGAEIPATPMEQIGKSIPSTYVPARNLIFVSLGASWADSIGAEAVVLGPNAVDYSGYPDCTPQFYKPLSEAVRVGTRLGKKFEILTPIIKLNKAEIVKLGRKLGAPLEQTWTCYNGGEKPCGVCESCKLRRKGFEDAGEREEY